MVWLHAQMPMGNNSAVATLEELLQASEFVTLHVPLSDATTRMIGAEQLKHMKKGRCDFCLWNFDFSSFLQGS